MEEVLTPPDVEQGLQNWLSQHVKVERAEGDPNRLNITINDAAIDEIKRQIVLREIAAELECYMDTHDENGNPLHGQTAMASDRPSSDPRAEFERAARMWCREKGLDPEEKQSWDGGPRWHRVAERLYEHWLMNHCIKTAHGE